MALKAAAPRQMPPAPKLTPQQMKAYQAPFPKIAPASGTLKPSAKPQTIDAAITSVQHFNSKSGVKEPKQFGRLAGFKPLRIPIVFHCLGYSNKDNQYLPPYNWFADKAAEHLVAEVNKLYKGTGFTFYVQQVRWDPRKHPYLNRGDLVSWQDCADKCWSDLASRYNVQGGPINIWVVGSFEGAFKCTPVAQLCQLEANGLATVLPGTESWKPGFENLPTQLIYLNYDRFSPDALNRPGSWEGGAVVVAHEIGHYFGLLHTFDGECTATGDAVSDTAPTKNPGKAWPENWHTEAAQWCKDFRSGKNPDPKTLLKMKSCKNAGGSRVADPMLNVMSYVDDACRMGFTEGQVARLQWAAMTYRPGLVAKYSKNNA